MFVASSGSRCSITQPEELGRVLGIPQLQGQWDTKCQTLVLELSQPSGIQHTNSVTGFYLFIYSVSLYLIWLLKQVKDRKCT